MSTATTIAELAKEYTHFQNLVNDDNLDSKEQIRSYEMLTNKMEEAGISYYELSNYVRATSRSVSL